MNMVIKTLLALSLSAIVETKAETVSGTLDIHEGFAGHMATTSQMSCQIMIKQPIINGTPFNNPDSSEEVNLEALAKSYGWSSTPPFELYNGECAITNPMDFLNGQSAIIHALPDQEDIADTAHYFFYMRRNSEGPDITYSISWNGYKGYTHAQWFLTEDAQMKHLANGLYCITDKKLDLCLK